MKTHVIPNTQNQRKYIFKVVYIFGKSIVSRKMLRPFNVYICLKIYIY